MKRREFLNTAAFASGGALFLPSVAQALPGDEASVMTVSGPIKSSAMGFSLTHEHILLGQASTENPYDAEDVMSRMLPLLNDVKAKGCVTFVDCTPSNLGRDVKVLLRLSKATGLQILTNTGYYGASGEKYLPPHVYTETAQQLADRWISEWNNGIGGTGIKPGFIKISVDKGPITAAQKKLMEAALLTHLSTGLTIAVHTGDAKAAEEQLGMLKTFGVSPLAWIWVHAGDSPDSGTIVRAAEQKGWVSFDHVKPATLDSIISNLKMLKEKHLLDQVLVSQDAGFYHVGQPHGGDIKPYTFVLTDFIPAMRKAGFTQEEIDKIFVANPARAFTTRIRKG